MSDMRTLTKAWTTVPKAAPMTTATARSTTLPRIKKSLKPLSMGLGPFGSVTCNNSTRYADKGSEHLSHRSDGSGGHMTSGGVLGAGRRSGARRSHDEAERTVGKTGRVDR